MKDNGNGMSLLNIKQGWLVGVERHLSPHCSARTTNDGEINLLVVHNISLPPGEFDNCYITDFFMGQLNAKADPYFQQIAALRVSAHCLIERTGHVVQYVSFDDKAWHAGVSEFNGRSQCNDFSIGIELQGTDTLAYTNEQYQQLAKIAVSLMAIYPQLTPERMVGHCDIAPARKTDPGTAFNWQYFKLCLQKYQ